MNKIIAALLFFILISGCTKKTKSPVSPSEATQDSTKIDTVQYVVVPQHDIQWPSLANSAWPKPLHDAQCTGRSAFLGPAKGKLKYTIPMSFNTTDVILEDDSTICFVSDTVLFSYSISGNKLWDTELNSRFASYNPPLINKEGVIYVGTNNGLSAFGKDGKLLWHNAQVGRVVMKSSSITKDGILLIISDAGTLSAIDENGNINWQINAPQGTFAWGSDNTISSSPDGNKFYVGGTTESQSLYTINLNGQIIRADSLGGIQSGAISVDNQGNIYSYFGEDLISISPNGSERWRLPMVGSNYNVVIDPDGNIDFLSKGKLISVDNIGQKRWEFPVDKLDFYSHLVCDANGTVFVESSNDRQNYDVQAVSKEGKLIWTSH